MAEYKYITDMIPSEDRLQSLFDPVVNSDRGSRSYTMLLNSGSCYSIAHFRGSTLAICLQYIE